MTDDLDLSEREVPQSALRQQQNPPSNAEDTARSIFAIQAAVDLKGAGLYTTVDEFFSLVDKIEAKLK